MKTFVSIFLITRMNCYLRRKKNENRANSNDVTRGGNGQIVIVLIYERFPRRSRVAAYPYFFHTSLPFLILTGYLNKCKYFENAKHWRKRMCKLKVATRVMKKTQQHLNFVRNSKRWVVIPFPNPEGRESQKYQFNSKALLKLWWWIKIDVCIAAMNNTTFVPKLILTLYFQAKYFFRRCFTPPPPASSNNDLLYLNIQRSINSTSI